MEPGTTTGMAFAIPRKRLDTTSEPSAVSTTSCGPFSLLPIDQLCCYKEQLPQPWAPFHARVFSRSRQSASLFPNFNLLAAREEFLERKRLRRVWLLDKQANGSKRLVGTEWGELSLGPFPSPGACLPSSFGASISSLTKTSACFRTEIAMRFSSGRNVENSSVGHSSCWCQAAWPGMNSDCNKSPCCLLQQPQKVQIECFPRPARRRESDLPRGALHWRLWEHPFLNTALPLAFPIPGTFDQRKGRDLRVYNRFLCGEIVYDMAEQTLILLVIHRENSTTVDLWSMSWPRPREKKGSF